MSTFIPTDDWQIVPEGTVLPPGLDIRMNLETGLNEARLMPKPNGHEIPHFVTDATMGAAEFGRKVGGPARPNGSATAKPELIMLTDCKLDQDQFWLIDDLLPRCSQMMTYGAGGCGKTYLGASIAFGFASGRWFAYNAEPGAVLICAFERPQDAEDRLAALRDHYSYGEIPIDLAPLLPSIITRIRWGYGPWRTGWQR